MCYLNLNRSLTERKHFSRDLAPQGPFAHICPDGEREMDLLYDAAAAWSALLPYRYDILCGKSKKLYPIRLAFDAREFYHLAGFPHLKDLTLPVRFSQSRAMDKVLSGAVTGDMVSKSRHYPTIIRPKLLAIVGLEALLNQCSGAYLFSPRRLPFYTDIRATYLLTDAGTRTAFLFTDTADSGLSHFARSAFIMDDRDYRINQTRLTVLQIERTDMKTGETKLLYRKDGFEQPTQEGTAP